MDEFLTESAPMSEEEMMLIAETSGIPYEELLLKQKARRATDTMNALRPEMRGNGRVQTAANPLEFLASGIANYKGKKALDATEAGMEGLSKRAGESTSAIIRALRARRFKTGHTDVSDDLEQFGDDLTMPSIDGGY